MANIPVGLIGCGGRGRGHVRALQSLADVELVAICDPVAANREQVGDEWGIEHRYADAEAMLDADELAAAIVATPAHLNAEAALPCLERGIDTLLEKPPGMSLDQTRALKEAAEASGARGMVGWNRRFDSLVRQVHKEIVASRPDLPASRRVPQEHEPFCRRRSLSRNRHGQHAARKPDPRD